MADTTDTLRAVVLPRFVRRCPSCGCKRWHHVGSINTLGDDGKRTECIRQNKMLPNFRARFCTRQIKIEPARKMMAAQGEVHHYVGLRADEETRLGGIFDDIGIVNHHPFREWGWGGITKESNS